MIIAKGKIITPDIRRLDYNNQTKQYDIEFTNGATYSYKYTNIKWLKNPEVLNPQMFRILHFGKELFNISAIYVFKSNYKNYWHICFENGSERDYCEQELLISKSCLDDVTSKNVFEYLKQTANSVSLKTPDGVKLLSKQYEKMEFVAEDMALSCYLNPQKHSIKKNAESVPIFPFGCNASQYKAVKNALKNQISVIQGPPRTGKTQTILNIIANILIKNKTVQVVSNNNSATANVLEKLSSPKYGMGFLVAFLGNSDNKKRFVENQTGEYPDISSWECEIPNDLEYLNNINSKSEALNKIYVNQETLALSKQEFQELDVELKHFNQYLEDNDIDLTQYKIRRKLKSSQLMKLWQECQVFFETGKKVSLLFKLKSRLYYGISDWTFYKSDVSLIINLIQHLFYQSRHNELAEKISNIEKELEINNANDSMQEFTDLSMNYLKNVLYNKYGKFPYRRIFDEDSFWKEYTEIQNEYPIVLSTTFSSRSSLCKDATFDYLIIDEASQVDVATGALALSCAKNVIIVGDTKQLPNVVSEDVKKVTDSIFDTFNMAENYRFSIKSFLQSVCETIPDVPQTLLREHYRCHPKIINFCNHKFYDDELVIMTEDNGEDVLSVIKTVKGNHARERANLRQIEVIKEDVLPKLDFDNSEIGIIAPYNAQVDLLKKQFPNSDMLIATVHKFQGREKDAIILTTVDNEANEFSDDPNLLNVAISRAKKQLCLVTSGNDQLEDSNIYDLISYIEYNNFSVTESKINSIFDYLYKEYTEQRIKLLEDHKHISKYDSENLMYSLIKGVLDELKLNSLDIICHQPFKMLVREKSFLSDEEYNYIMNAGTHIDFLIYNKISKKPVLAMEVDGYHFHKKGTRQHERDIMKNHILELYDIPYLRFATNGSGEKEKLIYKLKELGY